MTDLARTAHALSDPLRIRILALLAQVRCDECCSPANPDVPNGICACDLAPQLDGIAPSKLAYHLKLLRETDLIIEQPRGKWVYYTLNTTTVEAFALRLMERFAPPRGGAMRRKTRRTAAHAGA